MKASLVAGDTLDFLTTVTPYPAGDGWTLKFRLVPRIAGTAITFDATAQGDDYRTQVGPAESAVWVPGDYGWASYVEMPGARHMVDSGQVSILPDPAVSASATDTRSLAARAVDDLKAAYSTYCTSQGMVRHYTIGNRSMEFRDAAQILQQINYWEAQVAREEAAASLAKGLGNPRRFGVRFGPPTPNPWMGVN